MPTPSHDNRQTPVPLVPSSVHTEETTVTKQEFVPYAAYRREKHPTEWPATHHLYQHLDQRDAKNRAESLLNCGKFAFFTRNKKTGIVRVASSNCGLRWCPSCAHGRSGFIAKNLVEAFPKFKYPKFLTLTLRHTKEPLTDQIDRLYQAFRSLRHKKRFKTAVFGGIWFFQAKLTQTKREWHPHLHCLITGKYIPHALIKRLWLKSTGDSSIVDIRMVKDPVLVAQYVARYAARPAQLAEKSLPEQTELFDAMHGRKICGTWGDCNHIKLIPSKKINRDEWENLGSWTIVQHYAKFDEKAHNIIAAWRSHEPLTDYCSFADIDLTIDRGPWYDEPSLQVNPPPDYLGNLFDYRSPTFPFFVFFLF